MKSLKLSSLLIITLAIIIGVVILINNQYQTQIDVTEKIEKVLESDLLNHPGNSINKTKQKLLDSKGVAKSKPISEDELEKLIIQGIGNTENTKPFQPKTPNKKRTELDKLDELYASTRPAKVLLNSSGQPKAIYTSYTQVIESHSQFIDESKSLLDLEYKGASLNPIDETCINQRCVSRYQRMAFDVPVLFSDMALTTVDKIVTSVTGALNQPNINEDMVKNGDVLSEQELLAVAQGKLPGQWNMMSSTYGIYESTGGATAAYHIELKSDFRVYEMVIDARTKTVLNENDHLKHNTNASGLDLSGDRREFNTISHNDGHVMFDERFPSGAYTAIYDASAVGVQATTENNKPKYNFTDFELSLDTLVSSNLKDEGWNPSAVSVIGHFEELFNYFSETHNYRFGESGSYAQPIKLIVDIDYRNAFNLGTLMGFGRTENLNYAASFEVVGHELGHGIVGDLSGLRGSGWPSSLNESFSDLFGVLASPDSGWGVGDDSPNTVVRSMSNPSSFGGAMFYQQYNPEQSIYINAGISNYFFYLIAEGLTLDNLGNSIGRDTLSQLAFATLSSLSSRAEFNDVYNGLIAESERIYGENSDETQAIERAAEVIGYKQISDTSQTTVITKNSVFNADGINITAFLSPNFNTNYYDLYLQSFASNNPVYNEDNVIKIDSYLLNTAPAMATVDNGEGDYFVLYYKGFDNAIYYLEYDAESNITNTEFLSSDIGERISNIQVSSDFKYFAFTSNSNSVDYQNTIALVNIESESFEYLTPKSRSYTEGIDGVAFDYIDAIDFDPTNRRLVFDYLNCSGSEDANLENICAWQIGIYDLINKSYVYPFSALDRNINVANPSFANIDSSNIVFDLFVEQTNRSEVWTFNTSTRVVNSISSSITSEVTESNYSSRPFFTQDDSGIVFSVKISDLAYDGYLYHQPISDYDSIEEQEGNYLNVTNQAIRPITTSIEFIDANPSLTLSKASLDFGDVTLDTENSVCLSNSTTYPIEIYNVNNELSALDISAIPNQINAGKKYCIPFFVNVDEIELGTFSQDVRLIHDGSNSPSIITVRGNKVLDTDKDGIADSEDTDDDNDGITDTVDAYPLIAIGDLTDTDSDGAPDTCDEVCVALGMAADSDDDNDGLSDTSDTYPLVAIGELTDTDSDGAPDSCDEACVELGMAADTDDDNDGIADTTDAYPLVAIGELTDTDSDGAPDNCDEACVELGMAADADDDNDGITDTVDAYPLIAIGDLTDTDSDGAPDTCDEVCVALGMAADSDDDNDGLSDTSDTYPLVAIGELTDTDSDGAPDSCDEACVELGMAADTDDDNDGISDELEIANGLDPLDNADATLDADNDGVSNINEAIAGSNISVDDQPPVFTSTVSNIEVISTGLATLVELINPTASDINSDVVVINDSNGEFPVGITTVTYTATDEAGNDATLTQQVNVLPYLIIGTGRSIGDGQTIEIIISLNGTPATYPVTADIVIGGTASEDDFKLSTTSILITEGLTQTVELTAIDDGFGDNEDTVSLSLANLVNAGIQPNTDSKQIFIITEEQILPTVSVSVVQDDVISRTVDKLSDALFDIDIEDPNGLESLVIEWSGIANISEVDLSTDLTLDTSNMEAGVYVLTLSVTDNDVAGDNVVNQLITIKVIETLPELTNADSDGDGVSDVEEGLGDSDNDGIADYLDNTPQINLQPIGETFAQAQDGVTLALGATALAGDDNSIAIDPSSLPEDTSYEVEEVFDFTLSGLAVGASYELVLPLSQVIPEDAVYRKLTDNVWVDFVEDANNAVHSATVSGNCPDANSDLWEAGLVPGGNCLKLTIQDGSSNDTDGLENGTVEDPSGIAVVKATPTPTPTPTTPSSGGGSSGGSNTIYVLILLWLMVIGRRLIVRAKR
jgi:Zn-dependent metalloprotease